MLDQETFKIIVKNTPLFAIDLVVVNPKQQILLGKRLNAPAKDYWFVPGGRVYKNETLDQAFLRISKDELGINIERSEANFLGLYEHMYVDSVFDQETSTHYVNATHCLYNDFTIMDLPHSQHKEYVWMNIAEIQRRSDIHKYSKVFIPELKTRLV